MNELAITLDTKSGMYLYEQIYQYIKHEMIEGKLSSGERLPSTRALASHLDIARSTVELAYAQLLSEGYIESRPYRGYYVCPLEGLCHLEKKKIIPKKEEGRKEGFLYDMSPNGIEMKAFPFDTWRRISKNVLADKQSDIFELGHPQGDLHFRTTICSYLHSVRGVLCEPEQIIVGAGNDYLLLLLGKILGKKQRVAMESVTYQRARKVFLSSGCEVISISMDKHGMCVDFLNQSQANIAYIMPAHQFPTGIVMPIGRRLELLKWAAGAEDRYLIEDDYDSEFRYKGRPIPALQASDKKDKVIYIGTFSKSIAPAIRVSFMVLPKSLLAEFEKNAGFLSSTVSRIDQAILNEFIEAGHYERYLNKMRKIYKAKHDCLLEALKTFEEVFQISGEHAGLHVVLTAKDCIRQEDELVEKAARAGVRVYGMRNYCAESESRKEEKTRQAKILIGYAGLSDEEMKNAIAILKREWNV